MNMNSGRNKKTKKIYVDASIKSTAIKVTVDFYIIRHKVLKFYKIKLNLQKTKSRLGFYLLAIKKY